MHNKELRNLNNIKLFFESEIVIAIYINMNEAHLLSSRQCVSDS